MYKVGLALLALLFSVFFLPCPFAFFLFLLAYVFAFLAEIGCSITLFQMNQLKVNFGLLRDPSFLAARTGAVTCRFVF